MGQKPLKLC